MKQEFASISCRSCEWEIARDVAGRLAIPKGYKGTKDGRWQPTQREHIKAPVTDWGFVPNATTATVRCPHCSAWNTVGVKP